MGHAVTHVWHQVERPVSKAVTTVDHSVANVVRKIPVIGKPLTKAVRYTGAATVGIAEQVVSPSAAQKTFGLSSKSEKFFHRESNIGLAVGGTVLTAGALGAVGVGAQAGAAGTNIFGLSNIASGAEALGSYAGTEIGAGASAIGSGLSSVGSSVWGGISTAAGVAKNFLAGKGGGSMSGSSLLKYLKEGYGYVSGHGGLLGMAGSGLESAGSGLYSGAGTVFNGIGRGAQYAGGFLGGTSTQQALQGLSIKNLGSEFKSLFHSNQKISSLQSQLSLAKIKGMLASYQPQSQAAQMTPASSPVVVNSPSPAPIQAGFGGGSTMEILLFVGVAMGMMMFLRGKK